jgi:cholest-4-en-3-one 26-monooxygenase
MDQLSQDDLDLTSQDFFAHGNPDAIFRRLRAEDPVHWTVSNLSRGFWSVTKLEDVQAVYRDLTYRSGAGLPSSPEMEAFDADPQKSARDKSLVSSNPPIHTPLRKAFVGPFLQRAVANYEEPGRRLVAEIIDDVITRGECDFVLDVAARLPMAIICDMMQIPRSDWAQMFRWANMAMGAEDPEYQIEGGATVTKDTGYSGIFNYCLQLALKRRGNPGNDLLSLISNVEVSGRRLNEEEIGHNGFMFVIGGLETTRNSTSGGVAELIRNPGQMRKLRADRSLMRSAIEEIVRWTSPIVQLMRVATRDNQLHGRKISKGDWVVVWNASANRDEEAWDDPYRFEISRWPNDHVGFGYGPHFCLGAHLARLQMRLMLNEVLDRMPDIELTGPVERVASNLIGGIKRMPVKFTPRRASAA